MAVYAQLEQHCRRHPDRMALTVGRQRLNYGQLWRRCQQARDRINQLPLDRVSRDFELPEHARLTAICLGNHHRFVELFLTASAAPNVVAVLDPGLPAGVLQSVLQRLKPDLLILPEQRHPLYALARELGITVDCMDHPEHEVPESASLSVVPVQSAHQDDQPFLIGLTSGTTSMPKAFIRSRRSWRESLEHSQQVFSLHADMTTLAPGSMTQGIALFALLESLNAGAEFVTDGDFNVITLARRLAEGHIRRLVVVPTMIAALAVYAQNKPLQFPAVIQVVSAGAKFERHHWQQCQQLFPAANIFEYYGASELSFVSVNPLTPGNIDHAIDTVGHAFPGVEISIRDQHGHELPDGQSGQVYLRSPLICQGYLWHDETATFQQNQWGATVGDLGYLQDGRLTIVGRAGGMVVSRGHNIYLSEVERALKATGLIAEAVVLGIKDAYAGQRLVAIVQPLLDRPLTTDDLKHACRPHIGRHKIPQEIYRLQHWPLTVSGKIARKTLELWIQQHHAALQRL
ncbi:class I adenylate-forming enzyme family protein [Gynuella sunshinyii]|uniref:Acyl-CoA synthetase (AMP-forming)/AMP-acid ligase II n=1 Tax=Gynuella sunshinyii YC6258 TaxID=1445510 RepID=A0A0C5VSD1_9GAMM|nr:class I adenylate-forming enzyme family protein [Gynuella sunshinyii]AJQ93179.1 acyl-CoA synthetase (AMP-forming)/AMP-acid ligase II [Gynuella sunshinyii YC6258]